MFDYLEQKRNIADSLAANLTPVVDDEIIRDINGLDSSYSSFASAFLMYSNTTTMDDLVGLLHREEARNDHDLARQAATQLPSPSVPASQPILPTAN